MVRDLWHGDAFAWDAGKERSKQPAKVWNFARPVTLEEVHSESDDDDMEDDEERPEIADMALSNASENERGGARHTGKDRVVAAKEEVEPRLVASTGAGVGHEDGTEERLGAEQGRAWRAARGIRRADGDPRA